MVTQGHGEHPAAASRRKTLGKKYRTTNYDVRVLTAVVCVLGNMYRSVVMVVASFAVAGNHANAPHPTAGQKDWACDCSCAVSVVANVSGRSSPWHARRPGMHKAGVLPTVVASLLELAEVSGLEDCATCPALQHYRRLMRRSSASRLKVIAAEHIQASPCANGTTFESCVVQQAMAIMRIATLLTDMGELSRCEGAHRRAEARRATACASLEHDGLRLAHFQVHHATAAHGRTYQPQRNASATFLGLAVEGVRRDECDLSLPALSESLVRYHSMVLAEAAATIALGVGSNCLSLPEWISVASWQQDQKGAPLPCNNLTSFPYDSVRSEWGPTALLYYHKIDFWSQKKPAGKIGCRGGTYCHQLYMSPFWAEVFAAVRGGAPLPKEASGRIHTLEEAAGWTDSTQPLSQYAILQRHSMRTYAKLQLLLLVALYAQGTHWRNYGRWRETHDGTGSSVFTTFDPTCGCWAFEGRDVYYKVQKRRAPQSPRPIWLERKDAYVAMLFEQGSALFVHLTQHILNLAGSSETHFEHSWHWDLYGLVDLSSIETEYYKKAQAYDMRPGAIQDRVEGVVPPKRLQRTHPSSVVY